MKYTLEARLTTASLERHCLICSASGGGKSLLLSTMAMSLIASSRPKRDASVIIIEPHADLATRLMSAREVDNDRLIYISSTIQRESDWPEKITAVFNPFQVPKDADETFKSLLAAQLANALSEMIESSQYGMSINMEMLLRPAILVTLSTPQPSLNTLKKIFENDASLLQLGLTYPHSQIQDFFRNHFCSKDYDLTKRAVINKINFFLNDVALFDMVNGTGVDIEDCLNRGKIIIVNAPRGANPFVASFVGRMMIAYVFSIILRREAIPAHKRVPAYLLIDEANSYLTSSLSQLLHEARKYKLRLIAALQTVKGLNTEMRTAFLTNTFVKCLGISDAETRAIFAREMSISSDTLAKIAPLIFMVSRNDGKSKPFRTRVQILSKQLFLTPAEVKERLTYLIRHSGVYKNVAPMPADVTPPAPPTAPTAKKNAAHNPKDKSDNPFTGNEPAFTN